MLDVLANKRVLLLQGPAGPFFHRVARQLRARGATVSKVNFNAADDLFYRGRDVVHFRGEFEQWPTFLRDLLRARKVEALLLFGDRRPLHRMAIDEAASHDVRVFVIEEGYLRPDFVTLEEGGVSAASTMPRDPEFYRALQPTPLPPPRSVGNALTPAALYTIAYACTHGLMAWRYPHYSHHRDIRPLVQAFYWARGGVRRVLRGPRDRPLDQRLANGSTPPFFLVPLQVHLDAVVRDGPFEDIDTFIEVVVRSFAEHAPSDSVLIFKDHPLGRPYRDYSALLDELREAHGLGDRLCYADVIHLPSALRNARGVVTINSTVGLSSIHHGTPVKCLGTAVYDMPGLTYGGPLDEFWCAPGEVDADLYRKFRWWLRTNNQINGSVWRELWP